MKKAKPEGVIFNAPHTIEKAFVKMGFSTTLNKNKKSRNTLVFVNNHKEYVRFLKTNLKKIVPDSELWFAYPPCCASRNSGIHMDTLNCTARAFGITPVTRIMIDEEWSASRFRPLLEEE